MIDIHCHALPGIDDGPASTEQSLAMLRRAEADGIRTIIATPHLSARYPRTRAETVRAGVQALQAAADDADISVRLLCGAELELMHLERLDARDLPDLRLAGGPYSLVELPFGATGQSAEMLLGLHCDVQPVVLAHPERCRAFRDDLGLLERLVEQGLLLQVTATSFSGRYGSSVQQAAWRMLEHGLVHVVASDAHDATRRPPLLREPLEDAGLGTLVATLCADGPAAVLAGERPAPAPFAATSRRLGRWRARIRR